MCVAALSSTGAMAARVPQREFRGGVPPNLLTIGCRRRSGATALNRAFVGNAHVRAQKGTSRTRYAQDERKKKQNKWGVGTFGSQRRLPALRGDSVYALRFKSPGSTQKKKRKVLPPFSFEVAQLSILRGSRRVSSLRDGALPPT